MASGLALVHGAQLYYEMSGWRDRRQGETLLLLHAGVADHRMWDEQVAALAGHYPILRYDLRGFGKSLIPPPPPAAFAHYQDAAGLLDVLGVERAYVVGASFGGSVALDLALAYPERVAALVLGAPAVSGYGFSSALLRCFGAEEDAALARGDLEGATELNLRTWVDGPQRGPGQVDPAVRERVREMQLLAFSNPEPEGVRVQELAPPAIERLCEVQAPTLVVTGDLDVPEFVVLAGRVATRIPGAQQAVIAGAAHLPSMERPELYNRLLLDFLAEL
jgi:pimeloyl-ACP methyl ester carboxylesterase